MRSVDAASSIGERNDIYLSGVVGVDIVLSTA